MNKAEIVTAACLAFAVAVITSICLAVSITNPASPNTNGTPACYSRA